jgi:ribosomal protein S25
MTPWLVCMRIMVCAREVCSALVAEVEGEALVSPEVQPAKVHNSGSAARRRTRDLRGARALVMRISAIRKTEIIPELVPLRGVLRYPAPDV